MIRCLETRRTAAGYKTRRYETEAGIRYSTIEVPMTVWLHINRQGRGRDRAAAHAREITRENVRRRAIEMMANGDKPLAVAHELGVSVRSCERWRKKANDSRAAQRETRSQGEISRRAPECAHHASRVIARTDC